MSRRVLVVGGANGIGLAMATVWAGRDDVERVYVADKSPLAPEHRHEKIESFLFDVTSSDYSFFDRFTDIDTLMVTAGFGRTALFRDVSEQYIRDSFEVNTLPLMRLAKRFYHRLESPSTFRMGVMASIAGFMSSPFLAVYGATKAALKIFIESINVELEKAGTTNRILNVSPGKIRGTRFHDNYTDLARVTPLATEIIRHLEDGDDLFIPQYDEVFHNVLERYHADFRAEGRHSYEYKEKGQTPPRSPKGESEMGTHSRDKI